MMVGGRGRTRGEESVSKIFHLLRVVGWSRRILMASPVSQTLSKFMSLVWCSLLNALLFFYPPHRAGELNVLFLFMIVSL